MQRTDTDALIRHFHLNGDSEIECQAISCTNKVPLKEAFSCETTINGEPSMAFLCSDRCFLQCVQPHGWWQ